MSETTKKPNNVEVLKVEVKGENFAKAQLRCLETGETSWHGYYRKRYKPKAGEDPRTDAEILVIPGAKLKVAYLYQDGRAKNDGSGEKWPGDYNIKDVERLSTEDAPATAQDAREVFSAIPPEKAWAEDQARMTPPLEMTDKDKLIGYQSARRDAVTMHQGLIISLGADEYEKKYGSWLKAVSDTTDDFYNMVKDKAHDPFAG